MGPRDIEGLENAQYRYDMGYDRTEDNDDSECEDDLTMLDIIEEEKEEEYFEKKYGK